MKEQSHERPVRSGRARCCHHGRRHRTRMTGGPVAPTADGGPKAGVAVVTGGSRGVGRGIAMALGSHGYTVYVTGRTQRVGESPWGGTIHDTAAAITAAGGKGVAVRVDHRNDEEAEALFERVRQEEGRLDILVNNAALIREELQSAVPS